MRGGHSRSSRTKRARRRKVSEGIKVRAVKTSSGPPATAVEVQVEPERVSRQVGKFKEVQAVVAKIPVTGNGEREARWEEQPLQKLKEEVRAAGDRKVQYYGTHYGASEEAQYGVHVRIKTDAGTVEARQPATTRYADEPPGEGEGESE